MQDESKIDTVFNLKRALCAQLLKNPIRIASFEMWRLLMRPADQDQHCFSSL